MDNFGSDKEGVSSTSLITAKGTGDGVLLKINGEVELEEMIRGISEYIDARRSFLSGNQVSIQWVLGIPTESDVERIKNFLASEFSITVEDSNFKKSDGLKISNVKSLNQTSGPFMPQRSSAISNSETNSLGGLFGGMESIAETEGLSDDLKFDEPKIPSAGNHTNSMFWDNPDAMIMYATLRSGQKIETEHSLVLVGDVNCGAEIIAGGDVVVLGTLRGVVHAGAYDETGGGRFIFSLDLQPTQLRIGSVISRGAEKSQKIAEIAYVDGNMIVVEPYSSRRAASKMR